ncbi:hypothetical protein LINPERHAP1_LOCUS35658 [Linum perenne]
MMAADHWRKRVNGSNTAGCSSWEQNRAKKKKNEPLKNDPNTKSHISLEWDNHEKRVVAKREQIGIRQRDLRSVLVSSKSVTPNSLADVVTVPRDVFQLENLMEVLSPEVWQTCLSAKERKLLMKFLPKEVNADEVVEDLLSGETFHFGNPLIRWSTSLCSGNLHPDAILHQERGLKAAKRAHYVGIQNYHNDMISYLQMLKATCESSRDPETEVFQTTCRSRREAERNTSLHGNEHRFLDNEEKVATSESCSLVAEDKGCSSDNQNSSVKGSQHVKRNEKGSSKRNDKKPSATYDGEESGKGDKVQKHNIHQTDGAKYMSYLKISKKQHQLVKNMKQSGKSIQSKSLNRVLGNLATLHVQPYEQFVKEEENKLHEHWLQLANKDLPAAYANWRERQCQRRQIIRSLVEDLKVQGQEKVEDNEEEKVEGYRDRVDAEEREEEYDAEEQADEEEYDDKNEDGDEEEEEMEYHQPSVSSSRWVLDSQDKETADDEVMVENQNHGEATMLPDQNEQIDAFHDQSGEEARTQDSNPDDEETGSGSLQYQSPQLISSLGVHDVDTGSPQVLSLLGNDVVDTVDGNTSLGNSRNAIMAETVIGHGVPISSGVDVWSTVSMPQSYYDSTSNYTHDQDYISTPALMPPHQANDKQHIQMVNLGSHLHVDMRRDLLNRQSEEGSFSSCPNPDRSGLLQSLFKGQETSPYTQQQKQEALHFQPQSNVLIEAGHFNGHIQGHHPSLPLGQGQKRHAEDYMQQNLSQDVYSSGGGYMIPRQEHVQPHVNLQDWNVNPAARPPTQFPLPSLNGDGLLNQTWFPGDHQIRGGWNGFDTTTTTSGNRIPSQNIVSNADQTLFSVLSQCSQLRPSSNPLDSLVASSGQMMLPRNYNMVGGGGIAGGSTLPQVGVHTHDYFTGRDPNGGGVVMQDESGWMNLGHNNGISNSSNSSNSGFHDPMGKPYLRSWHQQ